MVYGFSFYTSLSFDILNFPLFTDNMAIEPTVTNSGNAAEGKVT